MAYLTQVSTSTLANQNINAALLVHTFTNTTRLREVWIDVFLTGIVGGGDYTAYITRQRAGAGVWYESIKTTKTVGAGIVSTMFNSIPLTIAATDAVKVYVLGLAGDSVGAVGIITEVNEEWVNIDASGRVDLGAILGAAITGTAAQIVAAFTKWFDVALPTGTVNSLPDAVPGTNTGLPILNAALEVPKVKAVTDGVTLATSAILAIWNQSITDIGLAAGGFGVLLNIITARIGAFTGTGINTILGFLRALAAKVAGLTPTDLSGGTTYDNTTDSLEALSSSVIPTVPAIVNGVLDEMIAGHLNPGSVGEAIADCADIPSPGADSFTYTVTDSVTGLPEADVLVRISTDIAGANVFWSGLTDAFGVARDVDGVVPWLTAGTYYFWRFKVGFSATNPDVEVVV